MWTRVFPSRVLAALLLLAEVAGMVAGAKRAAAAEWVAPEGDG
jgi:hypothetical protein